MTNAIRAVCCLAIACRLKSVENAKGPCNPVVVDIRYLQTPCIASCQLLVADKVSVRVDDELTWEEDGGDGGDGGGWRRMKEDGRKGRRIGK